MWPRPGPNAAGSRVEASRYLAPLVISASASLAGRSRGRVVGVCGRLSRAVMVCCLTTLFQVWELIFFLHGEGNEVEEEEKSSRLGCQSRNWSGAWRNCIQGEGRLLM
jgi:hypothetical protein